MYRMLKIVKKLCTLAVFFSIFVQLSYAQSLSVSGRVTDTDGIPLPGVNVFEKASANGTITDLEGN